MLAIPLAMTEIALHLHHFHQPKLQLYVIRILWVRS